MSTHASVYSTRHGRDMAKWRKSPGPKLEAPPDPASERLSPELEVAWAKLTQRLQPQAPSKDELAEVRALLTAPPPRERKQLILEDVLAEVRAIRAVLPRKRKPLERQDDPDFRKRNPRPWLVVLALDKPENRATKIAAMPKPELAKRIAKQIGASVSTRTLGKAEKYRREHPLHAP